MNLPELKYNEAGLVPCIVQDADKGATSGNTQKLVDLRYDCDADTLLALVHPAGPACHTGERTCFYRSMLEE